MRKQIFEKTDIAKTVKGVLEKISVVTFYENKGIDSYGNRCKYWKTMIKSSFIQNVSYAVLFSRY